MLLDSLHSTYKIFTVFISGLSHVTDEVKVTMLVVSSRARNFEINSLEPVVAKLISFMHSTVPSTILIIVIIANIY